MMGSQVRDLLPDMGLVNSRYTLILNGKAEPGNGQRTVHIGSWEPRPRIKHAGRIQLAAGVWYTVKFTVEPGEKAATIRARSGSGRGGAGEVDGRVHRPEPEPRRGRRGVRVRGERHRTATGAQSFYDNVT